MLPVIESKKSEILCGFDNLKDDDTPSRTYLARRLARALRCGAAFVHGAYFADDDNRGSFLLARLLVLRT